MSSLQNKRWKESFEHGEAKLVVAYYRFDYEAKIRLRHYGKCMGGYFKEERGIGTLELIFITVIVLGMAVLFRNQISEIFKKIYEALQKLNNNLNTDPLSQQTT